MALSVASVENQHEVVDVTDPDRRPRVSMAVASPGMSTMLGWPVGFWGSK